ncbi:MAG: metal-sulfur cluster assembly factor [Anaerolineae bacterium]|nr:metal-sulfur cluster assembly factor [Anaerolineae bacterium]
MTQKTNPEDLHKSILERLAEVIDPETGVDVVHMRLIEDLAVDETGRVTCRFRPSSPFCPLAVPLSQSIHQAISETEGVTKVEVEVVGLAFSDELMEMLKQAFGPQDDNG